MQKDRPPSRDRSAPTPVPALPRGPSGAIVQGRFSAIGSPRLGADRWQMVGCQPPSLGGLGRFPGRTRVTLLAGLDVGTTGARAVVIDATGGVVASGSASYGM